jgi:hypothetical protein
MTWDGYLEGFHAARPGIAESVLRRARAGGTDPYDWLAEVVPPRGRVLDLGCGSAPLFRMLAGSSWRRRHDQERVPGPDAEARPGVPH